MFLLSLFLTFFLIRGCAHLFHDKKNYGTKSEKSLTLTRFLRKATGLDFHHIHLGVILLTSSFLIFVSSGTEALSVILFGVGLSLVIDQMHPLVNCKDYFDKKRFVESFIIHVLMGIIVLIFLKI